MQNPKQSMSGIIFRFSKILEKFHFSISISKLFHLSFTSWSQFPVIFILLSFLNLDLQSFFFHLHFSKRVNGIFFSLSLLDCPKPILAGRWHIDDFEVLATFSPFVYHLISLKLTQNLQESLFSSWLVYKNRFPFWVYFLQSFAKALLLYSSAICQWEISEITLGPGCS